MTKKTFDCVEMKHKGADLIYEETKDMTLEQQLAFWQQKNQALRQKQQELRQKDQAYQTSQTGQ